MSDQDPELPAVTEGDGNGQPPAKMVRLEDLERMVSELVRKSLVPGQGASGVSTPGNVQASQGECGIEVGLLSPECLGTGMTDTHVSVLP